MPEQIQTIVEQSLANTVSKPPSVDAGGFNMVYYMAKAGMLFYPWWSAARDVQLANFWKQVDYLSGAIYTLESKMSAIPVRVQARDQSIKEHVREAAAETERLLVGAEWGKGWSSFYEKFVEELVTQDNGGFAEIIGAGRPDGPIVGRPVTVRILDSSKCQRTGDPIYPVVYQDMDGKLFKLHFTRVMYRAQMESTIEQMFGVGFCGVSRAISTSQSLLDILTYKGEKLGSRPRRGVIVTGGGLDPEDVASAFRVVESIEDSQGLSRYSKIAVVGDSSLPEAKMELLDLSGLPDGFDERTNVELGMAVISMALGMDARELFPALQSGATRADALIQHLKQRGKGPGQIIQMTELMFNAKYLPPHLKLVFDFQDDEEDRQSAETKEVRARRWATSIKDGSMDTHTARAQMVEVGDLERGQFERLELEDGRLADGTSVLALFYSDDRQISKFLDLGIESPLDVEANQWTSLKDGVEKQSIKAMTIIVNSSNPDERWSAHKALAALRALRKLYGVEDYLETKPTIPQVESSSEDDGTTKPDPRRRKTDLMRPQSPGLDVDELEPDRDEERMKEAGHSGAMIAFFLKGEDARKLSTGIDGAVDPEEMHLTIVYLGDSGNISSEQTLELAEWLRLYAEIIPPIRGRVGGTAMFNKVEDNGKHAVVALFDSPDMPHLRRMIMEIVSGAGIKPPREHGFIPHITLAYANENNATDINAEIEFDEISLVIGNKRHSFKLTGSSQMIEGKEAGSVPSRPFRG